MKKQYYIIGSGGFAKEVYYLAECTLDDSYEFLGFIDFKPENDTIKVRGKIACVIDEDYFLNTIKPSSEINIYIGVGDPKLIEKLSLRFQHYHFPNLIHKSFVGDCNSIIFGKGNVITAGCIFTVDIEVGSFNVFNLNTTIGHDTVIKNCNVFNPGCNISGDVNIGSNNLFGTNSTVLQGLSVNDSNVLGASSLANKVIFSNSVMVGVPAKKLER